MNNISRCLRFDFEKTGAVYPERPFMLRRAQHERTQSKGSARTAMVAIAAAGGALLATPAHAASKDSPPTYPTKPIRWVLGPSPDLLARIVGQKLTESWGQQVIVDARPGAGGAIAVDTVAKAPPDGYTWLMSSSSIAINQAVYPSTTYDLTRDVAPLGLMATIPFVLVVNPSVPAHSVAELIKLARAQPHGACGHGRRSVDARAVRQLRPERCGEIRQDREGRASQDRMRTRK